MQLSLREIAIKSGGTLSPGSDPDLLLKHVVIDSRKVTVGTLFVALSGETHNGHDFVESILNNQTAALVNRDKHLNLPNLIYVDDTIKALGDLARNYRLQFNIPIVGITGSNGKTTVKEMLKCICIKEFGNDYVLSTSGNFNNHLGMPLTLLNLENTHKVAIIEMGMNHALELAYLTQIAKPTIAVVNNAMLAHAGFFNDLSDIARAKGEIYTGLVKNGTACVNLADPSHQLWLDQLQSQAVKVFTYGGHGSECYLKTSSDLDITTILCRSGEINAKLQVLGEHNKKNALTATALALNLGCSLQNIATGLSSYKGYSRRLEQKLAFNGALIIDDSYNANPSSVKAAILAIKHLPKPHWFIFGDLGELGKFSKFEHEEIGTFAKDNGIDVLLTIGELSKISSNNFKGTKLHFANKQDVVEYCIKNLPKAATLLVKGSNSMALDQVINKLIK